MAMAGAEVLAAQLADHPGDVPAALLRYEQRLRPAVEARQRAGRRNAKWFLPGSALTARLRDRLIAAAVGSPFAGAIGRSLGGRPLPPA